MGNLIAGHLFGVPPSPWLGTEEGVLPVPTAAELGAGTGRTCSDGQADGARSRDPAHLQRLPAPPRSGVLHRPASFWKRRMSANKSAGADRREETKRIVLHLFDLGEQLGGRKRQKRNVHELDENLARLTPPWREDVMPQGPASGSRLQHQPARHSAALA